MADFRNAIRLRNADMDISDYSNAVLAGDFEKAFELKHKSIPEKVYKFFPLGISDEADKQRLESLGLKQLWFSPVSNYNDPYECKGLYIDDDKLRQAGYNDKLVSAVHSVLDIFGSQGLVCCFSAADYRSIPMWAYYANQSKGFCVEYDVINPRVLCEVRYESEPHDVTRTVSSLFCETMKNGGV